MAEDDAFGAECKNEGRAVDGTSEGDTRGTIEGGAAAETNAADMQAGDESADGEDAEEMDLEPGSGDEEPANPGSPMHPNIDGRNWPDAAYRALTTEFDEVAPDDKPCDPEALSRHLVRPAHQPPHLQGLLGLLDTPLHTR